MLRSESNSLTPTPQIKRLLISRLFKDKMISDSIRGDAAIVDVIKAVQNYSDVEVIPLIDETGFPISKHQKQILRDSERDYYNQAYTTTEVSALTALLEGRTSVFNLSQSQLERINDKFVSLVEDNYAIDVANLFVVYMKFLFDVNSSNTEIDKRKIHQIMINTQMLWEYDQYENQCANMHTYSYELTIENETITHFNELALNNPIAVANTIQLASSDELFDAIEEISKNPFMLFINNIELTPSFPLQRNSISCSRNEVIELLASHVAWLTKKRGYRLLNILDEEKSVRGILNLYRHRVESIINFITDEEALYKKVSECTDIQLIDYQRELKLAHVTQLFPILEIHIRELSKNLCYFPFKKGDNDLMQYNDPSSILREIILDSSDNIHGFDAVPDLWFIYNCMYNSQSLNVRNECIHGRGCTSQQRLHFALRTTLICILMVDQRLSIIRYNRRIKAEKKAAQIDNPNDS